MKFRNNKTALYLLILSAIVLSAFACSSSSHDNHKMSMSKDEMPEKQTYKSVGVINEINKEKGTITLDHEDIKGYMLAMQMTESVADKKLLEGVKVGNKVSFEIQRTGSKILVTKIKKAD